MKESKESIESGSDNDQNVVITRLRQMEEVRKGIEDQLHAIKEGLSDPGLSKLEKALREKEVRRLFESAARIKQEQAGVARSFAGNLKEGKDLLLKAGIDWFQKK